jgi:hypothetical protein
MWKTITHKKHVGVVIYGETGKYIGRRSLSADEFAKMIDMRVLPR